MGLGTTPLSERLHISFFGKINAGKSSVVNAVTGQSLSIVSDVKGTTTDPVVKTMELLPLGPVAIIDTPGFDDEGSLGSLRVEKTKEILKKTDIAVLVIDASLGKSKEDEAFIELLKKSNVPYIIVYNKSDITDAVYEDGISVSALKNKNIDVLKEKIAAFASAKEKNKKIIGDKIKKGSIVVLVTPIDASAPKGRIILPQQQVLRDLLDSDCIVVFTKEDTYVKTLNSIAEKPDLVITDSQVFKYVADNTPDDILLTSFSIILARYKGFLKTAVRGAAALDLLKDGDKILISEACTHHRQCEDIGTVKIPRMLKKYTGKEISFETSSGHDFPRDLSKYALVLHCGGCMINEKEMLSRMQTVENEKVPVTNYGTAIAYMSGILKRSIEIFKDEI